MTLFFFLLNYIHLPKAYCNYQLYFPLSIISFSIRAKERSHNISTEKICGRYIAGQQQSTTFPKFPLSAICTGSRSMLKDDMCFHKPCIPKAVLWSKSVSHSWFLDNWEATWHKDPRPRCDLKLRAARVQCGWQDTKMLSVKKNIFEWINVADLSHFF